MSPRSGGPATPPVTDSAEGDQPAVPPYGTGTLAEVLPSVAALLGAPGFDDALGLSVQAGLAREPAAVTVLLVDGLGWEALQRHAELTPHLSAMQGRSLCTTVPSTTPTALASLGTGMPPGAHGIVGAAFRLPEDDVILHPLSWRQECHPVAVQPEATVFQRLHAVGVPVAIVGDPAYAESGLTRAVLRGADYVGVESSAALVSAVASHRRGLAYAYLAELDRTGHVHGVDSAEWRRQLVAVDSLVGRLLDTVGERHRIIVTADHGMVDCPPESRLRLEDLPEFAEVTSVAGEPRMRHVYVRPGAAGDVAAAWHRALGSRAWVLTRDTAMESGLFGAVDEHSAERLGDIVVLARGLTSLTSDADSFVSGLRGQHGSVTRDELAIPLLQAAGGGGG